MKLTTFYHLWGYGRAVLLVVAAVILIALAIKAHSFNLEMEYTGPGSNAERLERDVRDREDREASERVHEGSRDPKDLERAARDEREHAA